jgi:TolB-like protein/DNA-binding winged helix-turn-helix (wHTH) protein/Tfp pilus assembly protein PilF
MFVKQRSNKVLHEPGRMRRGAIVLAQSSTLQDDFHLGDLHQVEPSLNSVTGPTGTIRLEPKVMQVLVLLSAHAGHVVAKERLLQTVWPDAFVTDDVLTRAISELRRVFGDDAKESRFIQTIPKSGYRLIARLSYSDADQETAAAGQPVHLETAAATEIRQPARTAGLSSGAAAPSVSSSPGRRSFVRRHHLRLMAGASILVVLAASWWLGSRVLDSVSRAAAPEQVSIAVLSFADLSPQRDQEYFTDGLAEELMTAFASVGLQVAARTSSFSFKGKNSPAQEIARQLDVQFVLEGSVRKAGSQLRIATKLIDGRNGRVLRSDSYDRELRDLFALQDEIARAVTQALAVSLPASAEGSLVRTATKDTEAHELYLRGRHAWGQRTQAALLLSIDLFNQAIARDAHYASAHAGLADAYIILGNYAFRAPNDAYPHAKRAAMEALRLDDRLAEAHTALAADSLWHEYEWAAAERELQRAIALNPNSAYAHHWYALLLSYLGRRIEAIEHIQRAERLDPLAPQIASDHSWVLYLAREYDRAVEQAQKVLSYEPGFANAHRNLGFPLIVRRRCEEGIVRLRRSFDLFGGEAFSDLKLAWAYARCGRADEARLLLSQALEAKRPGYLEPTTVAHVFVALGDHERALTWLERAVEERAPHVVEMAVEPALDPLRSDPRFVRLLERVGLPIIPPYPSTRSGPG